MTLQLKSMFVYEEWFEMVFSFASLGMFFQRTDPLVKAMFSHLLLTFKNLLHLVNCDGYRAFRYHQMAWTRWALAHDAFLFSVLIWKKTTFIINCFEIFIKRHSNLLSRAQTFSNHKHHNTVKVLIAIKSQRSTCFTFKALGGRTSNKNLTD